jgi:Tfp pilus assembly protein PilO
MRTNNPMFVWNLLLWASMAAMVGITIFHLATPLPKFSMTPQGRVTQEARARNKVYTMRKQIEEADARIASMTWKEDAELVGPAALAIVNGIAKQRSLKVASFRPQKAVTEGSLVRLPYQISLEGSYTDVVGFVRQLETPTHKLVVNNVQIASSDGETSAVKATIGIWAVQVSKTPEKPTRSTRRNSAMRDGSNDETRMLKRVLVESGESA